MRLRTIGYQSTTVPDLIRALTAAGVDLLVDVRAVANSRRPGFSKTKLGEALAGAGIDYLHLKGLGTPAEGRAASRAGRFDEMQRIFREQLESPAGQQDLDELVRLATSGRAICLLCFEEDPEHCHRSMVAAAVAERIAIDVEHLTPARED